jgi:hypothetical protein
MSSTLTFDELRNIIKTYYPDPPPLNPALGALSALSSGNFGYLSGILSKSVFSGFKSLDGIDFSNSFDYGFSTDDSKKGEKDSYYDTAHTTNTDGLTLEKISQMSSDERRLAFDNYNRLYDISLSNGLIDRPAYIYVKDITLRLFEVYD